jgi:hypothetical protein
MVETVKHREETAKPADPLQFGIVHGGIDGRHHHHDIDKGFVMAHCFGHDISVFAAPVA